MKEMSVFPCRPAMWWFPHRVSGTATSLADDGHLARRDWIPLRTVLGRRDDSHQAPERVRRRTDQQHPRSPSPPGTTTPVTAPPRSSAATPGVDVLRGRDTAMCLLLRVNMKKGAFNSLLKSGMYCTFLALMRLISQALFVTNTGGQVQLNYPVQALNGHLVSKGYSKQTWIRTPINGHLAGTLMSVPSGCRPGH